jgi:putative serine protease PepD
MTETPDYRATDPADQTADSVPAIAQPAIPEPPAAGAGTTEPRQESPVAPQSAAAASEAENYDPTTPLPSIPPLHQPEPTQPLAAVQPVQPVPPAEPVQPAQQPLQSPAGPAPLPVAPVWGAAPQPQPQLQPAQAQTQVWGAAPVPGGLGAPPPPNWSTPAPTGLPPFGAPDPAAAENGERKRPGVRLAVITAVIAGLLGGGVGAGIAYAVKGDNTTTTSSLAGSSNTTNSSSSLNTSSANANQVTAAAAKILPSVVTITVTASDGSGDEGTGIIISSTGQILTNNHVVSAAATGSTMRVTFASGKITAAKIIGRDVSSDLAVIQASGVSGLTAATLGDSSAVAVGQNVVAIGAPLGLSNTVTTGIVSALNRPVVPSSDTSSSTSTTQSVLDAIQTDASINPGNSGGPLVDLAGNVIGINSAIATASSNSLGGSSSSGSIGLGFAIPINQAKWIADELINSGTATHSLLGVKVGDPAVTATQAGAVVSEVTSGGPAGKAGIKVNDVVTKVNDQQIASADSLVAAIRSYKPGTTVTLTYVRGGQTATTQVTLTTASSN